MEGLFLEEFKMVGVATVLFVLFGDGANTHTVNGPIYFGSYSCLSQSSFY